MKTKILGAIAALFFLAEALCAQPLTALYSFGGSPDGQNPYSGVVVSGGTLFGVTVFGGSANEGTIFSIGTNGSDPKILYNFTPIGGPNNTNSDGANPAAEVIAANGVIYGTAECGGQFGSGTVFSVSTNGTGFTVLHKFLGLADSGYTNGDGANPFAPLTLSGMTLYGTAQNGGRDGLGVVFSITIFGTNYRVVHTFSNSDGASPSGSVQLGGGTLYGTTEYGGAQNVGVVFSMNTDGGDYNVLYSFTNGTGSGVYPASGLVLSGDTLYGTTTQGGTHDVGTIFAIKTNGAGLKVLHDFSDIPDGSTPTGGLIGSGNVIYGTTTYGGSEGYGTVFSIFMDGNGYNELFSFTGGTNDGGTPFSELAMTNGTLFGTADFGGANDDGTVFSMAVPIPPVLVSATGLNSNGTVTFAFEGGAGYFYTIESTTNLVTPTVWQPFLTNLVGTTGFWNYTETNPAHYSKRFFRLTGL